MPTEKLGLPLIASNLTADIVRDFNALAEEIDDKVAPAQDLVQLAQVVETHKQDNTSHVHYGVASGTNTKTVTLDPVPTTLGEGFALSFKNTTANSGAVTLNVNSLGAKPVVKSGGTALSSGGLKAGGVYTLRYDGASFILQGEGASGDALASDLLSGKTASTDAGDITGTMVNRGTFNLALGATVPAGYYSGGTVPNGKKFASGTISTGALVPFEYAGSSSTINSFSITVTGLTFKPSLIIVTRSGTSNITIYTEIDDGIYPKTVKTTSFSGTTNTPTNYNFKGDKASANVTSTGFTIPSAGGSGTVVNWVAFE